MRALAQALIGAICIAGCSSTLESRDGAQGGVGAAYMAPMRLLNVVATRGPAGIEPNQTQLRNAQTAFVDAAQAHRTAAATEATARAEAEAASASLRALAQDAPDALRTSMTTAETKEKNEQIAARAALDVAETRLNETRAAYQALIRASDTSVEWRESIEVTMGPARGDPDASFVADLNDSFFRSAKGRITIQGALLQSSEVVSTGQVGEIFVSTVRSLASILTAGGDVPTGGSDGTQRLDCTASELVLQTLSPSDGPRTVNLVFNPADPAEVRNVNYSLCLAGFTHRVFVTPPAQPRASVRSPVRTERDGDDEAAQGAASREAPVTPAQTPAESEAARLVAAQLERERNMRARAEAGTGFSLSSLGRDRAATPNIVCPNGICPGLIYRQPQAWGVHVVRLDPACDPGGTCNVQNFPYVERSWRFDLPNAAPLNVLPYNSSWFVARRDTLTFVDGSLVSHDFDHPSELAAAAAVPERVVRGAFEAISEVVELRVALVEDEESLANAERDYQTALADPGADEVTRLQRLEQMLKLELSIAGLRRQIADAEAAGAQ